MAQRRVADAATRIRAKVVGGWVPGADPAGSAAAWARHRHDAAPWQRSRRLRWRARAALVVRRGQHREGRAFVAALPTRPVAFPASAGARRILRGPLTESAAWSRPRMRPAPAGDPVLVCPAVAVLELPDDAADYARGRSRQAMRTNVGRARRAGCVVRDVAAGAEARDLDGRLQDLWGWRDPATRLPDLFGRPDQVELVAVDAADRPVAVATATVASPFAHLDVFAAVPSADGRGGGADARYLLHVELVGRLHALGVRTLLCECALTAAAGVRYQQRLLGFRPVTLRVGLAPAPAPRRAPGG